MGVPLRDGELTQGFKRKVFGLQFYLFVALSPKQKGNIEGSYPGTLSILPMRTSTAGVRQTRLHHRHSLYHRLFFMSLDSRFGK